MTRTASKPLLIALAAVALLATACGDSDDSATDAGAVHGQADIAFVQGMIPHHQQAITMSGYAARQASDPRVKDLAERIEAGQEPEIERMRGFLEDWDVEEDGESGGHGGGGGHPGMLTNEGLARLEGAEGEAFDRLFLQSMIEHHRGAIKASETEQAEGQSPEARALAGEIISAQRAEIATMEPLLKEAG